jgi:hypothetical protein
MRATVRRQETPFAMLLFALLLLTALERRLAEIDFNSTGIVRVENGEKVDGDEIFNRLVYVDDLATPQAPAAGEVGHADIASLEPRPLSLVTVRLSEPRAPPLDLSSSIA